MHNRAKFVNNYYMSYWNDNKRIEAQYPTLDSDLAVECAVIGGGVAGLTCAYELLMRNHKVAVIDARIIGSGASGNSTAMLAYSQDLLYDRLINKHGVKVAGEYLRQSVAAIDAIERIIVDNNIDCDFTRRDMYVFTCRAEGREDIMAEHEAYARLGMDIEVVEQCDELPFSIECALKLPNQACFNPYKYITALAKIIADNGGQIFENSLVSDKPKGNKASVGEHMVTADNYIIATHFPYVNFPGFYFAKMYQHRSYNVVFDSDIQLQNMYEEIEEFGFEYRACGAGKIMCGGANVRSGRYNDVSQYDVVERSIRDRFNADEGAICAKFSAQDCITLDMLPIVGLYGGDMDNVYVITGFNKWGFTNSIISAKIIADLIEGYECDNLFDSRRMYFTRAPIAAMKNFGVIISDFARVMLSWDAKKLDRIHNGQGAVIRRGVKRIGVYKDDNGDYHAVKAVCKHLGCSLVWNKDELTWDCPCHGSRYDIDGNLIESPSTKNADKACVDNKD